MNSRCLFTVPINNSSLEWLLCMEQLHSATAGLYFFSNDMKSTSIYQLNYSFRSSHHRCKPGLMNTIKNSYLTCTGMTDHFTWACSSMTTQGHCSRQIIRNQTTLIHGQNALCTFWLRWFDADLQPFRSWKMNSLCKTVTWHRYKTTDNPTVCSKACSV